MALITTSARLNFGSFNPRQAWRFNSISTFNLTTANGGLAFPFIAEKTMVITDIGATGNLSTTVAAAVVIGIQTDNGSGLPSGTFLTTGSITLPANTWNMTAQFACSSGNALINTVANHYCKVGDMVRFNTTVGGFAINTSYWVVTVPAANQMTVSTSATFTPVFVPSATVTPGANSIRMLQPSFTHCDGITASVTQGQRYWLCYQYTGTSTGQIFFDAGNTGTTTGQSVIYGLGYAARSAGNWAKVATTRGIPVQYQEQGTGRWYGAPEVVGGITSSISLNNNDRMGFRFSVPVNHPDILLDRISFSGHPPASPGAAYNFKASIYADNGVSTNPTFIADLSSISGKSTGDSTASNQANTIFQTGGTVYLTGGSSYIFVAGWDVTPPTGTFSINLYSLSQLLTGRNNVVGPYGGDFVLNWQGPNTWFLNNPDGYQPWSIISGGLRYQDTGGGGGGGFANATMGFGGIGGN